MTYYGHRTVGFTIVELLIVVVVIGIIATITVVAYSGVTRQAADAALRADLRNAYTRLHLDRVETDTWPELDENGSDLPKSPGTTYQYAYESDGPNTFCLTATTTHQGIGPYHLSSDSDVVQDGPCEAHIPDDGDGDGEGTGDTGDISN